MAEIFNKHVRKKIQENQSITHSDIYLMLNRYCELFSHDDTKPYPEELTYVLSCGLEKIKSIQSCTHIHAMHMPLIIDAMDYAICDLRTLMRKDYLASEIEDQRFYYLENSVHVLVSILRSIGLEHLVMQASNYISDKTELEHSWYEDDIWFPLTTKEKNEFQKSILCPLPNLSYIDNIPYEFTKTLHTTFAENENSWKIESTHDDNISINEIIKRLGKTYINGIIHIKNFLNDVIDKANLDDKIRQNVRTSLREKTETIIDEALKNGINIITQELILADEYKKIKSESNI